MIEFPPREAFEAWLRSKPPQTKIAKNWSCHSCPLANWLKEAYNVDSPLIVMGGYYYPVHDVTDDILEKLKPLPIWARCFIDIVDDRDENCKIVTAADCLNILEKIPHV